ncbi:hypothetical protein [Streptomyces lydicus]
MRWGTTEELQLLIALRNEGLAPEEALSYLRRYALTILALFGLTEDHEA